MGKHYELTQHLLFNIHIQQLLIIHPWIQSILHRMMHAPDLNSQMQYGTYRIQYQGNRLSVLTPHLGNHAVFVEATQSYTVTPHLLGDQPGPQRSFLPGDTPPSTKYILPQFILFPVSYVAWTMGIVKYLTMDELKRLSIPSEMLKFFNHSSQGTFDKVTAPPTYETWASSSTWPWMN